MNAETRFKKKVVKNESYKYVSRFTQEGRKDIFRGFENWRSWVVGFWTEITKIIFLSWKILEEPNIFNLV